MNDKITINTPQINTNQNIIASLLPDQALTL